MAIHESFLNFFSKFKISSLHNFSLCFKDKFFLRIDLTLAKKVKKIESFISNLKIAIFHYHSQGFENKFSIQGIVLELFKFFN